MVDLSLFQDLFYFIILSLILVLQSFADCGTFHFVNLVDTLLFLKMMLYLSEKCRCPAWCDRILWWHRDGVNIRQQFYESVESVVFSDHKPVRSIFHVEIRSVDEAKRDACLEEAIREADRRANEALPQIELSESEVN